MFVCFLTCSVLVVRRKFPAVSSGDLKGRQSNARHRTFNSEFRLKRGLRLNKQVIPASPSRKRYSRHVFSGPEKRSLNSETSDQDRKVRLKNKFKVFLVFVWCILSTLSVLKLLSLWEYVNSIIACYRRGERGGFHSFHFKIIKHNGPHPFLKLQRFKFLTINGRLI